MNKFFVFLISMIILASCGSAPPEETDWCWTYDFSSGDNGFNLAEGQWIDTVGLQTVNGLLSFSYEHDQFVTPAIIYVTVERPDGIVGTIDITAAGTIYGVSAGFSVGMPTDEESVFFTPAVVGDAGRNINVTVDVGTSELNVTSIRVEGNGETPFPDNPCSRITPTATFTESPTVTTTPTITLTPTITTTPQPTMDTPIPTNTLNPDPSPTPNPPCANLLCIYDHYEYSDAEIASQEWGYTRVMVQGGAQLPNGVDGGLRAGHQASGAFANAFVLVEYHFEQPLSIKSIKGWGKQDDTFAGYDGDIFFRLQRSDKDGDTSNGWDNGSGLIVEDIVLDDDSWHFFDLDVSSNPDLEDVTAIRMLVGNTRGSNFAGGTGTARLDNLIIELRDPYEPPATHTPFPTQGTATPTETPSPTSTLSPTPFIQEWCYTFDFTVNSHASEGFYIQGPGTGWESGLGYGSQTIDHSSSSTDYQSNFLRLGLPDDYTITDFQVSIDSTDDSFPTVSQDAGSLFLWKEHDSSGTTLITVSANPLNLPYTNSYSSSGFTADILGTFNSPRTNTKWYIESWYVAGEGSPPYPSLPNICDNSPTPTPTTTPTITRTPLPSPTGQNPTRTPIAYNSPTPQPTVDLTQTTATPENTLEATPTFITSTYIPSVTPYATGTIGAGTPTPSVEEIRENEAEFEILDEIQQNQNWLENATGEFFDFIGGAFQWIFQGIADIFQMIQDFFRWLTNLISSIFAILGEILGIIILIIQLMLGLISLLLNYIGQIIARLTALITAFFTAPPTPIDGLPLCITAPMSHDLCAIYYIMDWTLFAPNTSGQFIIPLVLAVMNVLIIFRAVRVILKFIRRGEDVTR